MKQLILLIPHTVNIQKLDQGWPDFLSAAEEMPGLIRESISTISQTLSGSSPIIRIYSFLFPDQQTLEEGLNSPAGQKAGALIHQLTDGKLTILTADYLEDEIKNIQNLSQRDS